MPWEAVARKRPYFVVRRTSASCNLTVGSWECRQVSNRVGKSLTLVPVPPIQLEELIHELSSDNVRENLAAATF